MSSKNLMKASNLGVCFGPTLMRPEHETVASIVDIRYQNIIAGFLILHVEEVSFCILQVLKCSTSKKLLE